MEEESTGKPTEKPAEKSHERQLKLNQLCELWQFLNQLECHWSSNHFRRACLWTSKLSPLGIAWASWSRHTRYRTWMCSQTATRSCRGGTMQNTRPHWHHRRSPLQLGEVLLVEIDPFSVVQALFAREVPRLIHSWFRASKFIEAIQ